MQRATWTWPDAPTAIGLVFSAALPAADIKPVRGARQRDIKQAAIFFLNCRSRAFLPDIVRHAEIGFACDP